MISSDVTSTVGLNIRTLVTRICSQLYSATNSQRNAQVYDELLTTQSLKLANRLGLTSYVEKWYESSEQYNRSLRDTLKECFPGNSTLLKLITTGDSYWSTYKLSAGGEQPTVIDLQAHQFCYNLAEQASNANGNVVDTQKIHACIYESTARCLYDQFASAYSTFFSDSPSLGSYSSVRSGMKYPIVCDETVTVYTPTANKTAGDEGTTGGDKQDTIAGGSARQDTTRDAYTRVSEPFNNHLKNTTTLHTRVMMSDQSENMIGSYDHARLANTFDKIQTSGEYHQDITTFFQSSTALVYDDTIDSNTNTKLITRFLDNQIGDRSIVSDDNGSTSTRLQTVSS